MWPAQSPKFLSAIPETSIGPMLSVAVASTGFPPLPANATVARAGSRKTATRRWRGSDRDTDMWISPAIRFGIEPYENRLCKFRRQVTGANIPGAAVELQA